MQTKVVHCDREPYDVYIGRPGPWGNPFKVGEHGDREQVIAKFRAYLMNNENLLARLPELKGKVLGCWCHPKPCHGDVLVEMLHVEEQKQMQQLLSFE